MAIPTAASKPSPDSGASFSTQGEKAGEPVPMVSLPSAMVAQSLSVEVPSALDDELSSPPQAARVNRPVSQFRW